MGDVLARILLRFYPETFRVRFGRELLQIWALDREEATAAGRWAALWFWLRWLPTTCLDALGLRLRSDPSRPNLPKSKGDLTMQALRHDLFFTLRSLGRQPGWCLAVASTLAVGLGASTAIFSIVNDVLLRPLPYPQPDRLVVVEPVTPESRRVVPACFPAYEDFRQVQEGLEQLDTWSEESAIVDLGVGPERRRVALTSAGLLNTLRLEPEIGRPFVEADDLLGSEPVTLLGHRLWRTEFGGDPGVLGRRIAIDEVVHTVVGVLPVGLAFPDLETDLWLPLGRAPRAPTYYYLSMLGRLDDGVSVGQLNAHFATLDTRMPNGDQLSPIDLRATSLREVLVGDLRPQLTVFLAAVLAVLLIACSNAAHLLLTRTIGRRRELSVRAALGAGRAQLARQLAVEGGVLGVVGGLLGLGLATATLETLRRLGPQWMPRPEELGLDATAVTFGLVSAVGIGAVLGLLSALPVTSKHPTLGIGSVRGAVAVDGQRTRSSLIVVQVAGALVLLGVAFLLMSTFREIEQQESGFETEGTLVVDIDLPESRYGTVDAQRAYYARLLESLRSLPGVSSATVASSHPFTFYINQGFTLDGYTPGEDERPATRVRLVADQYLETVGGQLLEGRFVEQRDGAGAVAINATFAKRYLPRGAVGQRLRLRTDPEGSWRTIVGVVADVEHYGRLAHWQEAVYVPTTGVDYPHPMTTLLRAEGDPLHLGAALRERVQDLDPQVPVASLIRMEELVWRSKATPRLQSWLLGAFGALALILAMIGLYGVMAVWVANRRQEIGLRLALGAGRGAILAQVLGRGLFLVGLGAAIGLVVSWPAFGLLRSQIPSLSSPQPWLQGAAALLLVLTSLITGLLPARRAARVDPSIALRES